MLILREYIQVEIGQIIGIIETVALVRNDSWYC